MSRFLTPYVISARLYYRVATYYFILKKKFLQNDNLRVKIFKKIVFIFPENQKKRIQNQETGNLCFELYQSCIENISTDQVDIIYFCNNFRVNEKNLKLADKSILFIAFFQNEFKRLSSHDNIYFFKKVLADLQNYILFIDLDFIHPINQYNYARLHYKFRNSSLLAIDIYPKRFQVDYLNCFGPRPLPYSKKTVLNMSEKVKKDNKKKKPAFLGTIYEYRKKMIKKLAKYQINLIVNPHKEHDNLESRQIKSYDIYLSCLSDFEVEINLSKNSREPGYQLKSRMMELSILGNKAITDGIDLMPAFIVKSPVVINMYPLKTLKSRMDELIGADLRADQDALSKSAIKFNDGFWNFAFTSISSKFKFVNSGR